MPFELFHKFCQRLGAATKRRQLERELDDEVAFHLAMREQKKRAAGVDTDEARYAARRQFGNSTILKERTREMWTFTSLETFWRDFTCALRTLRKKPGFTIVAVLTLALGIGASTAIFSVIENVLVSPFPYPDAQRFMTVEIHDAGRSEAPGRAEYSAPEYLDYVEKNHVFDLAIANASEEVLYNVGEGVERLHGVLVTPNTFEFFGMPALLGRVMQPADYEPGAPPVFILGYKAWMSHFAGDPAALNKTFVLNGVSRTLIGIMPRRFGWGDGDVFIPVKPTRTDTPVVAGEFPPVWYLIGHLKPGVSVQQAQADFTVVANQLAKNYPKSYPERFVVKIVSATDMVVGHFRMTLYLTLGAVALLLLISCANLANLLRARATTREEFESARRWERAAGIDPRADGGELILSIGGGALGVASAAVGRNPMVPPIPPGTILVGTEISLNRPVLFFALGIAIMTPIIFGLVPALRAARKHPGEAAARLRQRERVALPGQGRGVTRR